MDACAARRWCSRRPLNRQPDRRVLRRSDRPSAPHCWLCPGNEWATEPAEPCCGLRTSAAYRIRHLCRRFGPPQDAGRARRTAMVRKGSPVRVRQRAPHRRRWKRAFRTRIAAREGVVGTSMRPTGTLREHSRISSQPSAACRAPARSPPRQGCGRPRPTVEEARAAACLGAVRDSSPAVADRLERDWLPRFAAG